MPTARRTRSGSSRTTWPHAPRSRVSARCRSREPSQEGVVSMTENAASTATSDAHDASQHRPGTGGPTVVPPPPATGARGSSWTAGRITALVIGSILGLVSICLLGAGGTALWADLTLRDPAGYVTTGGH